MCGSGDPLLEFWDPFPSYLGPRRIPNVAIPDVVITNTVVGEDDGGFEFDQKIIYLLLALADVSQR